MCSPDLRQVRQDLNLHSSTPFYGWLVYSFEMDGFVDLFHDDENMTCVCWTGSPVKAIKYTHFAEAWKVVQALQKEHDCGVVAAFDTGPDIVVASPSATAH